MEQIQKNYIQQNDLNYSSYFIEPFYEKTDTKKYKEPVVLYNINKELNNNYYYILPKIKDYDFINKQKINNLFNCIIDLYVIYRTDFSSNIKIHFKYDMIKGYILNYKENDILTTIQKIFNEKPEKKYSGISDIYLDDDTSFDFDYFKRQTKRTNNYKKLYKKQKNLSYDNIEKIRCFNFDDISDILSLY